jgi:hypothetical protein
MTLFGSGANYLEVGHWECALIFCPGPFLCSLPTLMDESSETLSQNKYFPPLSCLCQVFYHSSEKANYYRSTLEVDFTVDIDIIDVEICLDYLALNDCAYL